MAAARELAGHPSVGGEQFVSSFSFPSLVCLGFYFSLFLLFAFSLQFILLVIFISFYFNFETVLISTHEYSHFCPSSSLSSHPAGG